MPRQKQYKPRALYFSPRLLESMEYIKEYPLTIVEAPSGFGKTTALNYFFGKSCFLDALVYRITFLAAQTSGAWNDFCNLIGRVDEDCGKKLKNFGCPAQEDIGIIDGIIQDMDCQRETYIILDNFMDADFAFHRELLEVLSRHNCQKLHFVAVITSVPGQRLRGLFDSRQIYRLRDSFFVFSQNDAAAYFREVGIRPAPEQLAQVCHSTEGWVFALYLQAIRWIENGSFEQSDMDGLIERSIWRRMDVTGQKFFLSISLTPEVTVAQASFMSGMAPEDAFVLLSDNGIVHYNQERDNFYLHALLMSYLKKQFGYLDSRAQSNIYIRAGRWAQRTGNRLDSVRFYWSAKAYERIFSLPLTSYEIADIVNEHTQPMILDLLENTPEAVKLKYPQALIPLAFTLFFMGRSDLLMWWQAQIRDIIFRSEKDTGSKRKLEGELELLLSFLEYNRIDAMSLRHEKALELLGGPATLINVKSTWSFGSPSVLYLFHRECGQLTKELEQMDACMPVYYRLTNGHGSGAELMMRAEALFLAGETGPAEILCHRAMVVARNSQQSSICQCGHFLMARIALMQSDSILFIDSVKKIIEQSQENTEDLCRYTLDLALGYLYAFIGGDDRIADWLKADKAIQQRLVNMTVPFAHIIYGRYLIDNKEYLRLIGEGEYFLKTAQVFSNILPQIYTLIYMAGARAAMGDLQAGRKLLGQAMDLALPDRLYMPFVENASILYPLDGLFRPAADAEALSQIRELSGAFLHGIGKIREDKPRLSPREYEVVALVKQNMTNRQIAKEMNVSISTVKTLLGRIFEKTGVTSRLQLASLQIAANQRGD